MDEQIRQVGLDLVIFIGSNRFSGADPNCSIAHGLPQGLNLVFLSIDTVRTDVLDDARNPTPNLNKLAQRAIQFKRAYAPASYTGKSMGPFIIGKNSSETTRDFSHFNAFRKEMFLQQRLHDAGIRTISVQGYWYFYSAPYGFERRI